MISKRFSLIFPWARSHHPDALVWSPRILYIKYYIFYIISYILYIIYIIYYILYNIILIPLAADQGIPNPLFNVDPRPAADQGIPNPLDTVSGPGHGIKGIQFWSPPCRRPGDSESPWYSVWAQTQGRVMPISVWRLPNSVLAAAKLCVNVIKVYLSKFLMYVALLLSLSIYIYIYII